MSHDLEALEREYNKKRTQILHEQSTCSHLWGETTRDDEIVKEGYGLHVVGQGSDCWSEYEGYNDKHIPRWKRVCIKCGKIEYTKNQKAVAYEPKF